MSDSTAAILEKLGGYHLQKRGEREVKVFKINTMSNPYSFVVIKEFHIRRTIAGINITSWTPFFFHNIKGLREC